MNSATTMLCLGLLVSGLALPGIAAAGVIVNPSFELDPVQNFITPTGWSSSQLGLFGKGTTSSYNVTDGQESYRFWSYVQSSFTAGQYVSISQTLDLTGVTQILFDVALIVSNTIPPFQYFAAQVLIDGQCLWNASQRGVFLDQVIPVESYSGLHSLELREICTTTVNTFSYSYWTVWDNLRAVPEPATLAFLAFGGFAALKRRR